MVVGQSSNHLKSAKDVLWLLRLPNYQLWALSGEWHLGACDTKPLVELRWLLCTKIGQTVHKRRFSRILHDRSVQCLQEENGNYW